jgi:hypothetical protein
MPNTKQIYQILNSINDQANTGAPLVETDATFISYGETIQNLTDEGKETWFDTLLDRIGLTIMDNRAYTAKTVTPLYKTPFEYGSIMQKIHAKMPVATQDKAWADPATVTTDPFQPTVREVEQRLYNKQAVWQVKDTIPDIQLKTAFSSAERMAAFFDNLMLTTQNSIERSMENLANLTRSALMAKTINAGGAKLVKLVTLYNTAFNYTSGDDGYITPLDEGALYNRDFLRFASLQIALGIDRMQHMTDIFAKDGYERFSDRQYLNFSVLGQFDDAVSTYLAADTYHDKLVELPSENKYIAPFWQATGSGFAFADASAINVMLQAASGATEKVAVSQTGIIALINDSEAAGLTLDERRVRSLYNPELECTNYWHKARERWYVDDTQSAIVYTLD